MVHKCKHVRQGVVHAKTPDPNAYFAQHLPDFGKKKKSNTSWVVTSCPVCANSKQNLILNVVTGAYRCFGCGINGPTVVHFHQHLNNLTLEQAAEELGCWGDRHG
jgi:hypothetical protein